mgnify:FL=1
MATAQRKPESQPLIPPARRLNAALKQSAARAQRVADAFGKAVPKVQGAERAAKTNIRPKH